MKKIIAAVIVALVEGLLDRDYILGQNYIMNMETKEIEKYPAFHSLQWVME